MKYQITHETEYDYSVPVTISQHLIHLEPRFCSRQKWLEHSLEINPKPAYKLSRKDIFGNVVTAFSIEDEHNVFKVTAKGIAEVFNNKMPDKIPTCKEARDIVKCPKTPDDISAAMFLYPSPLVAYDDAVRNYAKECFDEEKSFFDAVKDLNNKIYKDFKYSPGYTKIGTMPTEILRERKGVCQDFAHFMIACLRSLGYSAAYISGYLHTRKEGEQQFLGADATHAWVSVYLGEAGYFEFDPTNDCIAGEEHIIVSKGRDFGDVSPLKGVITGGGPHTLKVAVNVKQID
ncbi:MAG: transglutaminase family protein [Candidatus Gastranaerophilales bacterium]|nr:transglutaminase family protein [Candidatus Gastranaerophilales bacterium]